MHVQYGCGASAPDGWISFDASATLLLPWQRTFPKSVRRGDIVRGLPIARGSCDGIYASHVLEHLTREDCMTALANTLSYLRPGGIFRLVVPDLAQIAARYAVHGDSHAFMRDSGLGRERQTSAFRRAFGHSMHLWMWDERSMGAALEAIGFACIRRCEFGDCEDEAFRSVEDRGRFDGCLAIEARHGCRSSTT